MLFCGPSEVFQHVHFKTRILQVSRGIWGGEASSPLSEVCLPRPVTVDRTPFPMVRKETVGPGSLAVRASGSQTGRASGRAPLATGTVCAHPPEEPGCVGPRDSLVPESPEQLNSAASQERSFPSPTSKPLPELFPCPFTLLVLKSGQPDSSGRQPRAQRPRQTLSLFLFSFSGLAAIGWHL